MISRRRFALLALLFSFSALSAFADPGSTAVKIDANGNLLPGSPTPIFIAKIYTPEMYGAKGDGTTDDTAALQSAVTAAAADHGGLVHAFSKQYKISGTVTVPMDVQIEGGSPGSAAHNQNIGSPDSLTTGTTFLITGGAGTSEAATATFSLGINASIRKVKFYWPNQSRTAGTPTAYPYAIRFTAGTSASQGGGLVEDVELVNPYNGIDIESSRVTINRVFGQPINKGIKIDNSPDVDRLTNIHFNPYWSYATNLYSWQNANGIGLDIGNAQGLQANNLFIMGYKTGFWFHDPGDGGPYGTFTNTLTDECGTSIQNDLTNAVGVHFIQCGFTQSVYGIRQVNGILEVANSWFWSGVSSAQIINSTNGTISFHDNFINNSAVGAVYLSQTAARIIDNQWVEANRTFSVADNLSSGIIADNTTAGADVAVTMAVANPNIAIRGKAGIFQNQPSESSWTISNTNSAGKPALELANDIGGIAFGMYGSAHASYGAIPAGSGFLYSGGGVPIVLMADATNTPIIIAAGGNTETARFTSGGLSLSSGTLAITNNGTSVPPITVTDTGTGGHTFWLHDRVANTAGRYGLWDNTAGAYLWSTGASGGLFVGGTTDAGAGYLQSANGFKSTDGTAGASATTGGATFKNGLYTGGTISAGGSIASTSSVLKGDGAGNATAATAGTDYAGISFPNVFTGQNTFAAGTITTSQPVTITQTWNSGGVTFTGIKENVTNTASASASLLMDLQVGGTSQFAVDKAGNIRIGASSQWWVYNGNGYLGLNTSDGTGGGVGLYGGGGGQVHIGSSGEFGVTSSNGDTGADTTLTRASAGVWQMGSSGQQSMKGTLIAAGTATTCTGATIGTGSKSNAGFVTATTNGTSTVVVTFPITAPTGWAIMATDITSGVQMAQSAKSTTTATFTGATTSGDVIQYLAMPY